MTYCKRGRAALVLALALLLVSAVFFAPEAAADNAELRVSTVDELLAALAPDTTIILQPGVYDLSTASDYGQSRDYGYYTWYDAYDGYELVIRHADNLTVMAEPGAEVVLNAVPRYAEVLRFENCHNLQLSSLTLGHTQEPGQCAGGVLELDGCTDVLVRDCRLYGCGVMGVTAVNADTVRLERCEIYECSNGAVWARGTRDLRLLDSTIHDCPGKSNVEAYELFDVSTSTGFAVVNSRIYGNRAMTLLRASSSDELYFLGCEVSGNSFATLFESNLIAPVVEGCAFSGSLSGDALVGFGALRTRGGESFGAEALADMKLEPQSYAGPKLREAPTVTGVPGQDGMEYHVATVDELLACIGSNTTIYLDAGTFNWSDAANFGGYGGQYYYWLDVYDGPGLVISGVENFRLIGQGKGETTLLAEPRYADVISFQDCVNVTVAQLTAGHTTEPSYCMGDVLGFNNCREVHVEDCGLFGCGVWGISASNCAQGDVLRTEIYECSEGAVLMYWTDDFVFTDCSVHDCAGKDWNMAEAKTPHNYMSLTDCSNIRYNGYAMQEGITVIEDGGIGARPGDEGAATPTGAIRLFYYNIEISTGFTLTVGDEVLLDAVPSRYGHDMEFAWGVNDAGKLGLTVSESGMSCTLKALKSAPGGVTLTVSYGDLTFSVPVYIHD